MPSQPHRHLLLLFLLLSPVAVSCDKLPGGSSETNNAALGGSPPPLPPLPGDDEADDLKVEMDSGNFLLVIDSNVPRTGGYVEALQLRLAVTHRKGLQPKSKFESGILIGDEELRLVDGHFFLGSVDYGEIELPVKIVISRKGVIVDGKQRGDLPESVFAKKDEKPKDEE